jgi:hypothetical protein
MPDPRKALKITGDDRMSTYEPCRTGLKPCQPRDVTELKAAARLLGETAVMGSELSCQLQAFDASGQPCDRQARMLLQAWLPLPSWPNSQ